MKLQKIASLVLALIMIFSIGITAFAEEPELGSITINNASEDNTYTIYKLLDLESYDTAAGAYAYKVNSAWAEFFATAEALTYVTIDADGYVTWTGGETEDDVATFAKLALAYAKENGIEPVKSTADEDGTLTDGALKFEGLELGYYLIDSTMGALCGLTTTNPDASINAKNGQPTIDKQVKEDSTGNWGNENSADIGQTVEFRVTISVHAGAQNYILHDVMLDEFENVKVTKIEHIIPGASGSHEATVGTDYTVVSENLKDGCAFEVVFSEEFCSHLEINDKVIVYYSATLTKEATIALDGNPNVAWLSFGEGHETQPDETRTYTYGVDIVKTDSQNTLIDGAKFKIYDAPTGGNEVAVVVLEQTDDEIIYRRAAGEEGVEIEVKNGMVTVVGFDNGTYYLEETEAPDGYNKLTARQRFIISDANLSATFNGEIFSTGSGVHVVNKTGSMLPETGGIGTTIFYVVGGILVGGAIVVLVSKKRMSSK